MYRTAKAFSVGDIPELVFGLGIGAIIAAVVLLVMASLQSSSSVAAGSSTYNALGNGITGVGNVLAQYPLIGTVAGLVILLGFVVYAFYRRNAKEGGL